METAATITKAIKQIKQKKSEVIKEEVKGIDPELGEKLDNFKEHIDEIQDRLEIETDVLSNNIEYVKLDGEIILTFNGIDFRDNQIVIKYKEGEA